MTRRSAYHLAAAFFFLLLSLQPARASTWSTTVVDNTATATGKDLSIAVDPQGKLYLGYLDTGLTPYLKWANNAQNGDGSWFVESLKDILPNALDVGTATVYTPGGPRIMAYSNNPATGRNMYQAARKINGDGWQLQDIGGGINPLTGAPEPNMGTIVGSTSSTPGTQTGAVQYMGFTFITYNNGAAATGISPGIKYANERDMAWYDVSTSGTQSDLAVDSTGKVHVIYVDSAGTLYYVQNPTAAGQAAAVPGATSISNPAIAVDSTNRLHVIFIKGNGANTSVWYTSKLGTGAWSTPTAIGYCGKYGNFTALKADGLGHLHAVWYDSSRSTLSYMERIGTVWQAEETVPPTVAGHNYGQYAAIAIDRHNTVNIAYYDVTSSSINVVTKQNPALDVTPAPLLYGSVAVGAAATQTVTVTNAGTTNLTLNLPTITGSTEFAITSNNNCTDAKLLVPGASCTTEIRLSPTSAGAKTGTFDIASSGTYLASKSVTLKGSTDPSVNYTIYTAVYDHVDATTMLPDIGGTISPKGPVSVPSGTSQTFTITPDPGYLIAGVYYDGTDAQNPGTPVGAVTSYTFTEMSSGPHNITAVFYPVVPVTTWSIATVDNSGSDTGKYCSMAVDPAGKLHLGYLNNSTVPPLLKYSTNVSGTWSAPETVPMAGITNAGTATVSTPNGPRVMAYTTPGGVNKYQAARRWSDGTWQLQDIAGGLFPDGITPQPPIASIGTTTFTGATQHDGYTYISYTDGNNLWYANERYMYYHRFDPTVQVTGTGNQSDLTMDSSGNIHIVYTVPGIPNRLMYSYSTSPTTEVFTAPAPLVSTVVSDPSIAIDSLNTLHVAYIQSGRVMYLNGKLVTGARVWSTPLDMGPCGTSGQYTSIKANGLDIIHLAFYSNTNGVGQLMYAQRSANGTWTTAAAAPDSGSTNYGQYAALVVDDYHNVNIAYYDVTNSALKVATKLLPVISATPSPVNFGSVALDMPTDRIVTVTNHGQANLSVGHAIITGTDAAQFAISADSCGVSLTPTTTTPVATCSITVTFTPGTAGVKTATLHIPSNDPYTSDKQVTLTGTGVVGVHTIHTSAGFGGTISTPGFTLPGDVTVADGASITFTMTPDAGFHFGDVQLENSIWANQIPVTYTFDNVTSDHTIYAWFDSPYRLPGATEYVSSYFGTVQAAVAGAAEGDTVQCLAVNAPEDLDLTFGRSLSLAGGFAGDWLTESGFTGLRSLTVTSGSVNLEGLVLQ